jgi:hypothetical protein
MARFSKKKSYEDKMRVFFLNCVCNISHLQNSGTKGDHKCILIFILSARYSCQMWMTLEFSRQIFEKSSSIKCHENPSSRSRIVLWWQTDKHDEANSRFLQFPFYCCAVFVINIVNLFVHRTRITLISKEILPIFIRFFFLEDRVYNKMMK